MHATTTRSAPTPIRRWLLALGGLVTLAATGAVGVADATSPSGAAAFVPTNPCRLLDTRPGSSNVGGRDVPLGPDETLVLSGRGPQGNCTGALALPAAATGLQLNVTAVNASQATFLTLHPSDGERGTASHLNPAPGGAPAPNAVTVKLGSDGRFGVYNRFGTVDVIVDVVGIYTDHHHDDRYYTRADSDARYLTRADADALTAPRPWRVDVPMGAISIRSTVTTVVWNSFLPGTATTTYDYSFRLPDTYVAGTDVLVSTAYGAAATAAGACGFTLDTFRLSRLRDEAPIANPSSTWVSPTAVPGQPSRAVLTVTTPTTSGHTATYRIDGSNLQAGDWISVEARRVDDAADTCATITVVGVTATAA